jgi:iron complex outermembrane receptor protein
MFNRTKISAAAVLALTGLTVGADQAQAQQQLERVEITGSAIRRIEAEGSLPVQIFRREDIQRSGATNTVDLLQRLPGIQGGTSEGTSVGGGGAGFAGVSIHNVGETRTLVLLNGRRLSTYGGQTLTGSASAVDLNTIPIAAIERVEVLTDGASALYGSDAVAGVVNFITARNTQAGDITIGVSVPEQGGAEETRVTVSKGFGNLDTDGWNLLLAASADKRKKLDAVDRDFSKSGVINFNHKGQRYQAFLGSPRGVPANVPDNAEDLRNPYFEANGECAPGNVAVVANGKTACYFDFVAALEIYPERERQNFMAAGALKFGEHTIRADVLLGRTENTGVIAPLATEILIREGTPLHDQYLVPLGISGDQNASWRGSDIGKRIDTNKSTFSSMVLGAEGMLAGWNYNTAISHSENKYKNNISGYPGGLALTRLANAGVVDPFLTPGNQSAAGQAALDAIKFNGYWDGGDSKMTGFDVRGSRDLLQLPGGPLGFATGLQFYNEKFQGKPSLFAQALLADPVTGRLCDVTETDIDSPNFCDQRAGDSSAIIPYSADRNVMGVFAEVLAPVTKTLELTAGVRYDDYENVGTTTNGKLAFRWQAIPSLLVRGSVGTGFKAPTVPQLNASPQPFGVTSTPYTCAPGSALRQVADSLGVQCRPGNVQYDVIAGGNPNLEPEESKQATIGIRFEPTSNISLGADFWHVQIDNAIGQLTEDTAFANPLLYNTWTSLLDNQSGITYLALNQGNVNLGKEFYSGIDFDLQARFATPIGRLTTQLLTTYMLRDERQLLPGGPYFDPIGNNNDDLGTVTFKWKGKLLGILDIGNWSHTLAMNFQSGYTDSALEVEVLGPGDTLTGQFETVQRKIKKQATFDWQTKWQMTKSFTLTAGILNIFDEEPPLSLTTGGLNKGQMFGYDDRYYDPRGRTFYGSLSFAF